MKLYAIENRTDSEQIDLYEIFVGEKLMFTVVRSDSFSAEIQAELNESPHDPVELELKLGRSFGLIETKKPPDGYSHPKRSPISLPFDDILILVGECWVQAGDVLTTGGSWQIWCRKLVANAELD